MTEAKKTELRNLLKRGAFKVIVKEDVPLDVNVLPGRFELALKSTEDGEIKHKARYVIGGHRDKHKDFMVHSTTILQPQSIRLLLALASMFGFDVWTADVPQAHLQSAEPLMREIYINKLVPEFELNPDHCLQLLKPLYGLCDSGDLWHDTLDKHHREDLEMKPMRSDLALYIWMVNGLLKGLSDGYVDDLIRAGDGDFKDLAAKTNEKFDMADIEHIPCTFTGFDLKTGTDGTITIDQNAYLKKLEELPLDSSFSSFRSMRMRLAWLSHTRPDCQFEFS